MNRLKKVFINQSIKQTNLICISLFIHQSDTKCFTQCGQKKTLFLHSWQSGRWTLMLPGDCYQLMKLTLAYFDSADDFLLINLMGCCQNQGHMLWKNVQELWRLSLADTADIVLLVCHHLSLFHRLIKTKSIIPNLQSTLSYNRFLQLPAKVQYKAELMEDWWN